MFTPLDLFVCLQKHTHKHIYCDQ